MKSNISIADLSLYTISQADKFFPDKSKIESSIFRKYVDKSFERLEYCFSFINSKYFTENKKSVFDYLHGDHYSMFLYFLSNTIFNGNYDIDISKKLFLLNKALFGIDIFYEIKLPDIFLFVHPLGTVLGRATYSDYLIVYQRCNVGANNAIYPSFGEHITLHPGASVLGNCHLGNNCKLGANALLLDKNLKDNSLYIGNPQNYHITMNNKKNEIWE